MTSSTRLRKQSNSLNAMQKQSEWTLSRHPLMSGSICKRAKILSSLSNS